MKCMYCGFETEQDAVFCEQCGAPQTIPTNRTAEAVEACIKSPLFLAIAILLTVSCGLTILYGSLPLLSGLIAIFLWIVYAKSRKGAIDVQNLRRVSGTVFASYVINYILVGLLVLLGLLFAALFSALQNSGIALDEIINELYILEAAYIDILESILSISGIFLLLAFLVAAILTFLINFFGVRKIHAFVKSVYQGIQNGVSDVCFAKATSKWLVAFAVFSGLSALGSLGTDFQLAVAGGCDTAVLILSAILISKNFSEQPQM